jgi:hypothetical protein
MAHNHSVHSHLNSMTPSHKNFNFEFVATQIEQEPEAPAQNRKNWSVRFGKPDGPILSIPTTVAPPALDEGASPPAKRHLDGR